MSADLLAQHVDDPTGVRHRCVLLDARRLRCHDCARTLVLPMPPTSTSSTSSSTSPPPLHAPDRCQLHPGQHAGACGPCRAERLEAERQVDQQPTADVAAGAAAARDVLAHIAARRRSTTTEDQEVRS